MQNETQTANNENCIVMEDLTLDETAAAQVNGGTTVSAGRIKTFICPSDIRNAG